MGFLALTSSGDKTVNLIGKNISKIRMTMITFIYLLKNELLLRNSLKLDLYSENKK